MSPVAPLEPTLPESWSSSPPGSTNRFGGLRGVRWRIGLGILPRSSSIDDLRRVTADSRRRYASLRRCLLVDPHLPKDGSSSPDCVMDNPLSQNPDSMWGRFFRNAELERMVDQDLSRLYPEHGSYFQTLGCQSTLRRILLLWCLKHPECGYRQGMHELLAPLLYVLHADFEYLLNVRKLYEDHFVDKFDEFPFEDNDLSYNFDFKKFSESRKDELYSEKCPSNCISINELDPEVQDIVLLSDAYGAEGELGVVISDKYMEHDVYCMFDALMSGAGGEVSMAKFFLPSPLVNSHTGLPPVIEASSALYHLLSIVDSSIHSHLIELGVEPQYFSLRWLRVLFGREFSLEDLIIIWDAIFSCDNRKIDKCTDDSASSFSVLGSLRGAFISAFAVSMIVCMRSSLLATENATSCLQRLLNFSANKDLKKILTKAKSLQPVALNANISTLLPLQNGIYERNKSIFTTGLESVSPRTPLSLVPESYWEEKWRDLHKAEKLREGSLDKHIPSRKKGWSEKVRSKLLRAESAPSSSKDPKSLRRSLLEDLSKQLGSEEDIERTEDIEDLGQGSTMQGEMKDHKDNNNNSNKNMCFFNENKNLACSDEERCSSGSVGSGDNTSSFSELLDHNHYENQSGISSVASNPSVVENDDECDKAESSGRHFEESPLPLSDPPGEMYLDAGFHKVSEGKRVELDPHEDNFEKSQDNKNSLKEPGSGLNERKFLSGKFQWFWRFGRNNGSFKGTSEKRLPENTKACNGARDESNNDTSAGLALNGPSSSLVSCEGESVDQNMMVSLRNIGRTMLDNIQVIESVLQQERGQEGSMENFSKNVIVGKGQVTAMSALKELRKISNLLSEM